MCKPPPDQSVRNMLGAVVPSDVTIEKVQIIQSLRPQKLHEVVLSDGRTMHLVQPPPSMWRPMRYEQDMVTSEAVAVRWIRETLSRSDDIQNKQKELSSASSPPTTPETSLLNLLPTLLHQGHESNLLGSSFAVYSPLQGTPLALLPQPPSDAHHTDIQTQLGCLFRRLAHLKSPTGRFGPAAAVLAPTTTTKATAAAGGASAGGWPSPTSSAASILRQQLAGVGLGRLGQGLGLGVGGVGDGGLMSSTGGAGTWSVAFHSMLEGVLRDGEDMAVAMGYATIRRHVRRLAYLLDEVGVARLVVVEGGGKGNVLVVEEEEGEEKGEGDKGGESGEEEKDGAKEKEDGGKKEEEEAGAEKTEIEDAQRTRLRVTGLRDWSSCVFGDPLLAAVFSDPQQQPPSTAFLEGLNGAALKHVPSTRDRDFPLSKDIIADVNTAWIRLLLYQVYHAVVHVVGEFYRPRPDSSTRELEARRKLNAALAQLAEVPDDPKRKHQRPSGAMSPAKRLRGGSEGRE